MDVFLDKIADYFKDLGDAFVLNFIKDNRWHYVTNGLKTTLIITFCSVIIGIVLGMIVASVRSTYDKNKDAFLKRGGFGVALLRLFNAICKLYLTVIRGTPIVVQLLIMYYIVFASTRNAVPVAIAAFGINSGAYVAEIFRGGIMAIDNGQFEAGRSLGFNYFQTMIYIIMPQVFKNVLPTLCNEFIALLKETSVSGYIALQDLTKGIYIIIGRTYSYYMPLLVLAGIYLIIVVILTRLVGKLERRLRSSER
jgi:arginine/lysine/histidine transport system permease protein